MLFAFLALLDFAIAWILNAASVSVPHAVDNWGMLFLGLVFVALHMLVPVAFSGGRVVRREP